MQFKYSNVLQYLKQFDGVCNFIDLYNSFLINEYFGQHLTTSTVKQNHIQLCNSMIESNYYMIHNNCQLNITNTFVSRKFRIGLTKNTTNKVVQDTINQLTKSEDYLNSIHKKIYYVDASSVNNVSNFKLYHISNNN